MSNNVFQGTEKQKEADHSSKMHLSDLPVGIVDQRNMSGNLVVIKFGTTRPDGGSDIKAFFNTSSGVLSLWDGSSWVSVTLS